MLHMSSCYLSVYLTTNTVWLIDVYLVLFFTYSYSITSIWPLISIILYFFVLFFWFVYLVICLALSLMVYFE